MRGSLSEFTLAELLQLYGLAEKSGMIQIAADEHETRLYLEAGRVTGWGPDNFNAHSQLLACSLLPAESAAALSALEVDPAVPGLSFVVRNLVNPARWNPFVQRILEQNVYPMLPVEVGEFETNVDRVTKVPLTLDITVQQLILDGSRWEADLSELAREGYGLSSAWERSGSASLQAGLELSTIEWLVWTSLNRGRTIAEVARSICFPDLDTTVAIKTLYLRRIITRNPS